MFKKQNLSHEGFDHFPISDRIPMFVCAYEIKI